MKKLRLFAVKQTRTNTLVTNGGSVVYFASKPEAKAFRDSLGKDSHSVTEGPDHRNYIGG